MQTSAILLLTFRELWAKKITVGLLVICTLVWVMLAFALNLDIVEGSLAGMRIFGAEATPTEVVRDPETGEVITNPDTGEALQEIFSLERVVIEVERVVAGLSYWAGILLALFATSSLLPSLLAPVRERGTNFSAGQRQLLSFARALAHGSDILVLDEATSSIDTETEALVQQGIHALMEHRTALVIAHRLSTIQDVDRIHVLHRGRIVESGAHDELMALSGVYHKLYQLQYASQRDPKNLHDSRPLESQMNP